MRYLLTSFLCAALMLSACKKTAPTVAIPDGTYTGIFQRQTASGGQVAPVSLVFSGATWTGQGQVAKYPALCNGTYKLNGNTVSFTSACIWTADFDWTLILTQDYDLTISDKQLEISRDKGTYRDIYKLTRQ